MQADVGAKAVVRTAGITNVEIKWINTKKGKGLRNGQPDGVYSASRFKLLERIGKDTEK